MDVNECALRDVDKMVEKECLQLVRMLLPRVLRWLGYGTNRTAPRMTFCRTESGNPARTAQTATQATTTSACAEAHCWNKICLADITLVSHPKRCWKKNWIWINPCNARTPYFSASKSKRSVWPLRDYIRYRALETSLYEIWQSNSCKIIWRCSVLRHFIASDPLFPFGTSQSWKKVRNQWM